MLRYFSCSTMNPACSFGNMQKTDPPTGRTLLRPPARERTRRQRTLETQKPHSLTSSIGSGGLNKKLAPPGAQPWSCLGRFQRHGLAEGRTSLEVGSEVSQSGAVPGARSLCFMLIPELGVLSCFLLPPCPQPAALPPHHGRV